MPKRPFGERDCVRSAKIASQQRRHLYLVLGDWHLGYSIRKVDLSPRSGEEDTDSNNRTKQPQRLPPAVFRLQVPHGHSGLFASFGTKIVYLGTSNSPWGNSAPAYDVRTRSLIAMPLESEPNSSGRAYLELGGKFFCVDYASFEMLEKVGSSWVPLPDPPYQGVISYAVHPNERTMFFSMLKRPSKVATFSFDTQSSLWTRIGEWIFPFKGRGYFDSNMDAWVGLSCYPNIGHICACNVVLSATPDNGEQQAPDCKISKEKLFCPDDPLENHWGATLLYIGGLSRFCLIQTLSIEDHPGTERYSFLLRVSTFFLTYDKNGDLRVKDKCQVGMYRLPSSAPVCNDYLDEPVAFWM